MEQKFKGWVARDHDCNLHFHSVKPTKSYSLCSWGSNLEAIRLKPELFTSVKWEDDEPTETEITIKIKGHDD